MVSNVYGHPLNNFFVLQTSILLDHFFVFKHANFTRIMN
jgi:hypothetical protein